MGTKHPFLLAVLLLAIGMRSVLGAPCCMFVAQAAEGPATSEQAATEHGAHAHHHKGHSHAEHSAHMGRSGHGDDPSANPCCTACGPTLPAELPDVGPSTIVKSPPQPAPIPELETRPPFPAYEARGPPLLV